jgi:hypothetical protein
MMKHLKSLTQCAAYLVILAAFVNMGSGADSTTTVPAPRYVELDEDAQSYLAQIVDNGKKTEVKDISFAGHTKIDGLRQEDENGIITSAHIKIDLGDYTKFETADRCYYPKSNKDAEYVRIRATHTSGSDTILLFPKRTTISARSIEPGMRYAWNLRDIDEIIIHGKRHVMSGSTTRIAHDSVSKSTDK